jgi:hypothetical protein
MPDNMIMYFATPTYLLGCANKKVEDAVTDGMNRQGQGYLLADPHRRANVDAPDASWRLNMGALLPGDDVPNMLVDFDKSTPGAFFGVKHMSNVGEGFHEVRDSPGSPLAKSEPPNREGTRLIRTNIPLRKLLKEVSDRYPNRYNHVVVFACNPPATHAGGILASYAVSTFIDTMRKTGLENASKMTSAAKKICGSSLGRCWPRPRKSFPSKRNFTDTFVSYEGDPDLTARVVAQTFGKRRVWRRFVPLAGRAKQGVKSARENGRSLAGCPCETPCGEEYPNLCRTDPRVCRGIEYDVCKEEGGASVAATEMVGNASIASPPRRKRSAGPKGGPR